MRVNYVIAAWCGPRHYPHNETSQEYLRKHIEQLNQCQHSLAQVTISCPTEVIPADYQEYLDSLSALDNGCLIKILARHADRRSYGSWNNAFAEYRDQFDYYIFVEDDYAPAIDGFDGILIDLLETKQCGYLCGLGHLEPFGNHAAVSNGIAKASTLEAIYKKLGGLFNPGLPVTPHHNQLAFSCAFGDCGFTLEDWTDSFGTPYWDSRLGQMRYFGPGNNQYIFVPYQWFPRQIKRPKRPKLPKHKGRVNYVIGAWCGARANPQRGTSYEYIRDHLKQLARLEHNLDQITISHPSEIPPGDYKDLLNQIDDPKIQVITKITDRRSYGSWANAFEKDRDKFDYYIFIEDDYVPVLDHFDTELIKILEETPCDYLCGLISERPRRYGHGPHMAISNGIAKSETLEVVYERYNCLINLAGPPGYSDNQVVFSDGFTENGFQICDYLSDFRASFWYSHNNTAGHFGDPDKPFIIVPIQQFWDEFDAKS